ncbi:MAG: hypothetical protein K0S20_768 [Patescibacteria group bacterium]|nr:hypothetical protein [Patescibacteria group bacterium]
METLTAATRAKLLSELPLIAYYYEVPSIPVLIPEPDCTGFLLRYLPLQGHLKCHLELSQGHFLWPTEEHAWITSVPMAGLVACQYNTLYWRELSVVGPLLSLPFGDPLLYSLVSTPFLTQPSFRKACEITSSYLMDKETDTSPLQVSLRSGCPNLDRIHEVIQSGSPIFTQKESRHIDRCSHCKPYINALKREVRSFAHSSYA